ncbi:hypothetical protein K435DRAFT_612277, partial [Dendrothele bispora CBS 962.96]
IFRVIWDVAFEVGRQVGISDGRGEVRAESIEEGKRLGVAIAKNEAEMAKTKKTDVSIDTSDLDPPQTFTSASIQTSPSTASHCSVSVETDILTVTPAAPANTNQESKLDWAEDATSLPNATLFPLPSITKRDFTTLRSQGSHAHPFHSLHRRS